jgi:hypothetical protein
VKRGSEYFAVPTHDRDVVLPNASYPGSFEGLLRSLEGTAEFETFRPFVMEPDNGVNEDELVLQLRTEAARLLPCDSVCLAFAEDGFCQVFEKSHGHQSAFIPSGGRKLRFPTERLWFRLFRQATEAFMRFVSELRIRMMDPL